MSNNETNDKNKDNAVTAVEVVKDDTVMYEDGDFEDYNADQDYTADDNADNGKHHKKGSTATDDQPNTSSDTDKDDASEQTAQSSKNDKSDKDSTSDENDQSEKDDNASKKGKSSKKDKSDQDDKSGITMASLYQWASKLKDDFTSEASDLTHGVTEKAAAAVLTKLRDGVDIELAAFDKSVEAAKELIKNAEERRKKIASKKDKYQDMIDKLDQ